MKLGLTYYFLLYQIYSCAGWLLEVSCKSIEYKRFINRGFLIGPYCPIYGWGALSITFLLYRYSYDPFVLFIMTIIICGILEYSTSWFMEQLFKARWWDYSNRKFNLNGRVCLGTLIPFGIFGLILTYITNPLLINLLNVLNENGLNIVAIVFLVIYLVDNVISITVILGFRKTAMQVGNEQKCDNTEQITKRVQAILSSKSWTYKRLINAYPKLVALKSRIQEITDEVKENAKELRENINEKATDFKNTLSDKAEDMKNNINERTEEMKNSISDAKNIFVNSLDYSKRKVRVNLKLSKKKIKKKFTLKKNNE